MAMATAYDIGDVVELEATFTNTSGGGVDPTAVKLTVRQPDGTETTYTYGVDSGVTSPSAGLYRFSLSLTAAGRWYYRWQGIGLAAAAEFTEFRVRETPFVT
jgi:hypothetical protein